MTLYCTTLLKRVTIPLACLWLSSFWLIKNAARPAFTERHKIKISQSLREKRPLNFPQIWKDTYEWMKNCWKLRKRGELELEERKRTGLEKKRMAVFKWRNTMGISLKTFPVSSQSSVRTYSSEKEMMKMS